MGFSSTLSQMVPPAPKFTEKNVPEQAGKVILLTGATAGVGLALANLLINDIHATVYIGARDKARYETAVTQIVSEPSTLSASHRRDNLVRFLPLDLADLSSVRDAARELMTKETRLDLLISNAGVMQPPQGSETAQGIELQLGVNAVAPFLLAKLLGPLLASTAAAEKAKNGGEHTAGVRVIWVSSSAAELTTQSKNGGIDLDNINYKKKDEPSYVKYGASKAAVIQVAMEYARRYKDVGVISVPLNPGNLKTELRRYVAPPLSTIFDWMSHPAIKGAYTELYAAFSPDISLENSGSWVIPWGRLGPLRPDILAASKPESEGGSGVGLKLWNWCESQIEGFLL